MIVTQPETTKLTLKIGDVETSWEIQGTDCKAQEILHGFCGLMVAQTFHPNTVMDAMKNLVEEHSVSFNGGVLPATTDTCEDSDDTVKCGYGGYFSKH